MRMIIHGHDGTKGSAPPTRCRTGAGPSRVVRSVCAPRLDDGNVRGGGNNCLKASTLRADRPKNCCPSFCLMTAKIVQKGETAKEFHHKLSLLQNLLPPRGYLIQSRLLLPSDF